jgi:hypothetical protein
MGFRRLPSLQTMSLKGQTSSIAGTGVNGQGAPRAVRHPEVPAGQHPLGERLWRAPTDLSARRRRRGPGLVNSAGKRLFDACRAHPAVRG